MELIHLFIFFFFGEVCVDFGVFFFPLSSIGWWWRPVDCCWWWWVVLVAVGGGGGLCLCMVVGLQCFYACVCVWWWVFILYFFYIDGFF